MHLWRYNLHLFACSHSKSSSVLTTEHYFSDILAQFSLCSSTARLIFRPDFLLSLLLPSFSQTFHCFALAVFRQPLDSVSSQQHCHSSTMSGQACQVHSWHFKHTSASTCGTLLPPKGQNWQHNTYSKLKEFVKVGIRWTCLRLKQTALA